MFANYYSHAPKGNIGIYLILLFFVGFGLIFFAAGIFLFALNLSSDEGATNIMGLAFSGFGLLFALIGLIPMIITRRTKRRGKELLANGRRISAKYTNVFHNTSISVNGRHPYHIMCQWIDPSGQLREFKSEALWYDPYYVLEEMNVKSLDVYLDEINPRRYYVDVRRYKPMK